MLGSGLGNFSNKIKQECTISYADIDGFPVSTNKMHAGRFIEENYKLLWNMWKKYGRMGEKRKVVFKMLLNVQ